MEANYRIKHHWDDTWEEVYVDHKTGRITLVNSPVEARLSDLQSDPNWEVEPLVEIPFEDFPPGFIPTDSHYTSGDIECVDYLYDNMPFEAFVGFLEGNVKKYLHRWRLKGNPVKDLRKARDYLNVLIDVSEGKRPEFKEWKDNG